MTQKKAHLLISTCSAMFAGLCVEFLPWLIVAIILSCAVSVIGIAVEKEIRHRAEK